MDVFVGFTIKIIIGFVAIVFMFRVMGRKELAQMTPLDMLWVIVTADFFGGVVHSKDLNVLHLLFLFLVWGLLIWGLEKLTHKSPRIGTLINGEPILLIQDGEILEEVMKKENLNKEQIHLQLREKGIFDIDEVQEGVLEVSGKISILTKKEMSKHGKSHD